MMAYETNVTMDPRSSCASCASFYCDGDDRVDVPEQELRLQDVFERPSVSSPNGSGRGSPVHSSSSKSLSHHSNSSTGAGPSSDDLVRQFNASVGSASLPHSVAEFYLDMCGQDLDSAVEFFKSSLHDPSAAAVAPTPTRSVQPQHVQQRPIQRHVPVQPRARAQPPTQPQRARSPPPPAAAMRPTSTRVTPRRMKSHDVPSMVRPRMQTPKRNKSFDAAEVATVTAPPAQRTNHDQYCARTLPPKASTASIPRRCSVAVTPATMKVPFRARSRPAMPMVRSKSERRVREYPTNMTSAQATNLRANTSHGSTHHRNQSPTRQLPARSRSSESHNLFKQYREGHYYQNNISNPTITRPPTAARNVRQMHGGWEPPSIPSNPAA